jgi:sulfatase modifying factor 1
VASQSGQVVKLSHGIIWRHKYWWVLPVAVASLAIVLGLGVRRHTAAHRCGPDWQVLGPRCCAAGQWLEHGHCVGKPRGCAPGFHLSSAQGFGCVIDTKHVSIGPLNLSIGPDDWQSEHVAQLTTPVEAFEADAAEVTYERWQACVAAGRCRRLTVGEPGQPVASITAADAQMFCAFAKGRVPTRNQRLAMAAGAAGLRFPWGQTGLVCRRAAFGLVAGPCAESGSQPDVTGSRTDGRSGQGMLDLSGNVAEIAVDSQAQVWACGGSFRSIAAQELKSWSCVTFAGPADDVGLRCVYDTR